MDLKQFEHTIAGAGAGAVGTVLGFPLDALKSRMQIFPSKSAGDIFKSIYVEDGLRGYYRGVASPLVALVILNSMNFSLYAKFKDMWCNTKTESAAGSSMSFDYRILCAAMSVGPFASLVSTPFEYVKIQMQLNKANVANCTTSVVYKNALHAARNITKTYGLSALYTAHTVNTMREMVFLGTYFGVYEHCKDYFCRVFINWFSLPGMELKVFAIPFAGGLSGAIGWFVSYPLDCIKGNQQQVVSSIDKKPWISVGRDIIAKNGIIGLYSGVSMSIIRAFIVSASRFSCYEFVLWCFDT